jgi:hypothetical protein
VTLNIHNLIPNLKRNGKDEKNVDLNTNLPHPNSTIERQSTIIIEDYQSSDAELILASGGENFRSKWVLYGVEF